MRLTMFGLSDARKAILLARKYASGQCDDFPEAAVDELIRRRREFKEAVTEINKALRENPAEEL